MVDGTPRIILDLSCSLSEVAAMGLTPGAPFALARITNDASMQKPDANPETKDEPPSKGGINSKWAAMRCQEPVFWGFLNEQKFDGCEPVANTEEAAHVVRSVCGVESRAELDTDAVAEQRFHELIRKPFAEYMRNQ
jgi:hypothetical protein